MKRILLIVSLIAYYGANAQSTGVLFDFNKGLSTGWGSGTSLLTETNQANTIKIAASGIGPSSESSYFLFSATPVDLTNNPFVSVKIKTDSKITIRIDLVDENVYSSNNSPITREVNTLGEFTLVTFNFSGLMKQKTPSAQNLTASKIIGIDFYINPGAAAFTGNVFIDDLAFGTSAVRSVGNGIPGVKVDQLGFYPNGSKVAIASSTSKTTFSVQNESNQTLYSGNLGNLKYFSAAQDCVKIANFTDFTTPGKYKVVVEGIPNSAFFEIKDKVHFELSKAAIKYYYFNRLSTPLETKYAGKWARAAGHPDNTVYIHASASNAGRPENTVVSAPKGWYDAGDYNKYVVNSAISTYTLMALYERFSPLYDTLKLNIPESTNAIPDLLDEIKWNLDWMVAMQDPTDGGAYFKLTSKNFIGDIMPNADNTARYMVGKSTSSSLDYAATMAMAYRIFEPYNQELNGFADTCILRAYRAYKWAKANPSVSFSNPSDIRTGGYGDNNFQDEFSWAASELYISSQDDFFYPDINLSANGGVPSWNATGTLGVMSLCHNIDFLGTTADKTAILNKMASNVSSMKTRYNNTAYLMPMNSANGDYFWGSNAVAANQSLILLQDYYNTGDAKSYEMAKANLEYLLGRNPLEYCFVTGFGAKSPKYPHHRPSVADGVADPVPGMLVGGPNDNHDTGENNCIYQSTLAALEYTDQGCSYSTNEIAINWNAPLAFVSGAIEAKEMGLAPSYKYFRKGYPLAVFKNEEVQSVSVYPNPATNELKIRSENDLEIQKIEIMLVTGESVGVYENTSKIDLTHFENGIYLINISTDKEIITKKFNVVK